METIYKLVNMSNWDILEHLALKNNTMVSQYGAKHRIFDPQITLGVSNGISTSSSTYRRGSNDNILTNRGTTLLFLICDLDVLLSKTALGVFFLPDRK